MGSRYLHRGLLVALLLGVILPTISASAADPSAYVVTVDGALENNAVTGILHDGEPTHVKIGVKNRHKFWTNIVMQPAGGHIVTLRPSAIATDYASFFYASLGVLGPEGEAVWEGTFEDKAATTQTITTTPTLQGSNSLNAGFLNVLSGAMIMLDGTGAPTQGDLAAVNEALTTARQAPLLVSAATDVATGDLPAFARDFYSLLTDEQQVEILTEAIGWLGLSATKDQVKQLAVVPELADAMGTVGDEFLAIARDTAVGSTTFQTVSRPGDGWLSETHPFGVLVPRDFKFTVKDPQGHIRVLVDGKLIIDTESDCGPVGVVHLGRGAHKYRAEYLGGRSPDIAYGTKFVDLACAAPSEKPAPPAPAPPPPIAPTATPTATAAPTSTRGPVAFVGTGCDSTALPATLRLSPDVRANDQLSADQFSDTTGTCYNFLLSGFEGLYPFAIVEVVRPDGVRVIGREVAPIDPPVVFTQDDANKTCTVGLCPNSGPFGLIIFFANGKTFLPGTWQINVLKGDTAIAQGTFVYPVASPTGTSPSVAPAATDAPVARPLASYQTVSFSYDAKLASTVTGKTMPQRLGDPWWLVAPEHIEFAFEGYPVIDHVHLPTVAVFPVSDYTAISPQASAEIDTLRALLASKPDLRTVRAGILPVTNAGAAFHAKGQYVDFQGGAGFRYVTLAVQNGAPFTQQALTELFYSYEGLTVDGKYLVTAEFPVMVSLPLDPPPPAGADFTAYNQDVVNRLTQAANDQYTPNLDPLDAVIKSITVRPVSNQTPTITPAPVPLPQLRDVDWNYALTHDPDLQVGHGSACPATMGSDLTVRYRGSDGQAWLNGIVYGDLDGDGVEEALIPLITGCTGSASYASLIYHMTANGPQIITAGPSSDHLLQATIANQIIEATGSVYLAGDAGCCPSGGTKVTRYRLQGNQLIEVNSSNGPPPAQATTPVPTAPSQLVYVSPAGDLSIANVNGTQIRTLVTGPIEKPVWSHDGKKIAYLRRLGEQSPTQIEMVNADGSGKAVIVPQRANPRGQPQYQYLVRVRWERDDSAIDFAYSYGNSSGKGIVRHDMQSGAERDLNIYASDFDVAPDGMFVTESYDNATGTSVIALVSPGGQPRPLFPASEGGQMPANPVWSPDGTQIALRENGIRVVSRDLKHDQTIRWPESAPQNIAWRPDGTALYYTEAGSSDQPAANLFRVTLPNGTPQRLFMGKDPSPRP